MNRADVDIVRDAAEAFGRSDWARLEELCHPDVEFHEDPSMPEPGVYRGGDRIARQFDEFNESFAERNWEIEDVVEGEGGVAVLWRQRLRAHGSDAIVEQRSAGVWTVRDGKIARVVGYLDQSRALADAAAVRKA